MKFIEVSSNWDYGALSFENSDYFNRKSELYDRAFAKEDGVLSVSIFAETEDGEEEMELHIKALNFENVSDDFLGYVINELCDYDTIKNTCIYKVED